MPFDDDDFDPSKKPTKGLKIDNSKSSVSVSKKNNSKIHFEKIADSAFLTNEEYKYIAVDLATRYKSMILDSTLSENKTSKSKDEEKFVCENLVNLASKMNNDENQEMCVGSVGLISLLLKMLLLQRDEINDLKYKSSNLSKFDSQNSIKK